MTKISQDINYPKALLDSVFKCPFCGSRLLMFGCETENCDNYYIKRIHEDFEKDKTITR